MKTYMGHFGQTIDIVDDLFNKKTLIESQISMLNSEILALDIKITELTDGISSAEQELVKLTSSYNTINSQFMNLVNTAKTRYRTWIDGLKNLSISSW